MRERAGAEGSDGGRSGASSSGDGAAKVCHSCGGEGHIQPSCVVPDLMNRHELLAKSSRGGVLPVPPNLQKYKPPPGCRCSYCAAAPTLPPQAYVVDVFPPEFLDQRVQVYSVRAGGGGGEVASEF